MVASGLFSRIKPKSIRLPLDIVEDMRERCPGSLRAVNVGIDQYNEMQKNYWAFVSAPDFARLGSDQQRFCFL